MRSRGELRRWLERNHARGESVWIVTYRKGRGREHVPWSEVVDEALCFGWIDSLPRRLDEARTMVLLSPRRPKSAWSRINKDKAERLIAAGAMTAAGLAKIEAAKRDGSWGFLDDVSALIEPEDLARALAADPAARQNFDAFSPSARRGVLEWIKTAKQPATRARRVAQTVTLAAQNIKANHPRAKR